MERIEETIQRYGQYWAQNTERRQIKQKNKTPKTKKISNTDSGACEGQTVLIKKISNTDSGDCEGQTVLISYKFCLIYNDDFLLLY